MADEPEIEETAAPAPRPRPSTGLRVARWVVGMVVGLALLVGLVFVGLNTSPGKRFIVSQIAALQFESGMKIGIGRIDGSIYSDMTISGLTLSDTKGVFLTSPEIRLDWSPFRYLQNHISVRTLSSPRIEMLRMPQLKPTASDPNAPLLPDLDIDVDTLSVRQLVLAAPVAGERRIVTLNGSAHIADGRAQIVSDARADSGDWLAVNLDAVPAQNKLDIRATLQAPVGGVVAKMGGLKAPLSVIVDGKGSWQRWNGRLLAKSGAAELANVAIAAHDGRFTARGPLRPGVLFDGPIKRLTSPALALALDAGVDKRRIDLRMALRSNALSATAAGLVDLGRNRFEKLRLDAALLTPGAIMENVSGRDVRASVTLDGDFATPFVDYDVTASRIAFDTMGVEGLRASGRSEVRSDRILIPLNATARRVTGLNAAAGGLLENVRLNGNFAYAGGKLISDDLRVRSSKIDATAIILADVANGLYRGALKGRVNDYRIDGVGIINLTTDIDLQPAPGGGFQIGGRFGVRTAKLENASVRDFLGGNAVFSGRIGMNAKGDFSLTQLRGRSPAFVLTSGSGRYGADGRIAFDAVAQSDRYGPLRLTVAGTLDRPQAVLRAARPNVGVQLSDVVAKLSGEANGYRLEATGGSEYGPFFANVLIRTAKGPLTIDIAKARFAGVDIAGTLRQTAAGPFAGRLTMDGSGINGTVQLAAVGKYQGVDVNARAANAKLPGDLNVTIGRALVTASMVLYDQPQVIADAQFGNMTYGETVIRRARAKVNYRGGTGNAQMVADGSTTVPFTLAANVALRPNLYAVALKGRADRVDFTLQRPAIIRAERGGYRLEPAILVLPQGNVRLAGRFGGTTQLQARFDDFDLAIVNIASPGLGVGGKASGTLDYLQQGSAFPTANARMTISNFTRTSLARVSEPVGIALEGRLGDGRANMSALIRRNTATVGRMVASIDAAGSGGWTERLQNGALSGGIRYNGPADVLFSLAGQADQRLTGPLAMAADFSGRLSDPRLNGLIRANSLTYENDTFGTRITNIALDGRFTNDRLELRRFDGRAGEGTVSATGTVSLAADSGFPLRIDAKLSNARLARSESLGTVVDGTLSITNDPQNGALIKGDLELPELRYKIVRQGGAQITELTGVRRKGQVVQATVRKSTSGPPSLWKLDVRVHADNRIYVSGMGLESEWQADMRVGGTTAAPRVMGQVELIRGTLGFAGRRFDLTDGEIEFNSAQLTNPSVTMTATTTVESVEATINVAGTAQNPQITFSSSPALPQDEILSRILFGSSVTNLSAVQAIQLAASLNSLRGGGGGLNPLGKLQSASGIDRLRVLGEDKSTGRGTALAAGQYLTDDIYVEIITDARGFTATQLEVALSKVLSVLTQNSSVGGTSVNLRYSRDY